eukprot:scaffold18429_cov88-Cyclotella_meneghiniana.AAC.1
MAGTMGMLKELGRMTANVKASKKLKDCQKDCCLVHYLGTRRALKKVEMRGTQMAWTKTKAARLVILMALKMAQRTVGWREIQTALMMVDSKE